MSPLKRNSVLLVTKKPIDCSTTNTKIVLKFQWADVYSPPLLFYEYRYMRNKPSVVRIAERKFHRCCEGYYMDISEVNLVSTFFKYLSDNYVNTIQKWKNADAYEWIFTKTIGSLKNTSGWILDLGAGHGFGIEIYKKIPHKKLRFVSFDLSKSMLYNCPIGIDRILGEAAYLPFADQCLSSIVAVYMLHYLAIPDNTFKEIARTLIPGGIFGFVTYRHDSQKDKYREILEDNDFKIVKFKKDEGNPPEYRSITIKT